DKNLNYVCDDHNRDELLNISQISSKIVHDCSELSDVYEKHTSIIIDIFKNMNNLIFTDCLNAEIFREISKYLFDYSSGIGLKKNMLQLLFETNLQFYFDTYYEENKIFKLIYQNMLKILKKIELFLIKDININNDSTISSDNLDYE
ncbi:hypothetical protein MXB_5680, partial [Myxobolus squamalis]